MGSCAGLGSSAEGRFWRGAARSRALSPGLVISSALLPEGSPGGRRFPGTGCFGVLGGLPAQCCVARGRRALCRQRSWQASRPACGVWFSSCGPVPGDLAPAAEAPGIPQLPQKAGHGFSAPRASVAFFPARAEGRQLLRPGRLCWHRTVALCARGLSVGNRGGGCGGLLLVFPLQTIPVSGVGLSRSDVPGRYSSSKLPSCLRHWSAPASEHLESSPWADLESRTKEGKQLLKAACFSELLSENKTVRGAGALQAP